METDSRTKGVSRVALTENRFFSVEGMRIAYESRDATIRIHLTSAEARALIATLKDATDFATSSEEG
jgi:hypothetical protein